MKNKENSGTITVQGEREIDATDKVDIAEEIGKVCNTIDELKRALQLSTADYKGRINVEKSRLDTLEDFLSKGRMVVDIECREVPDFKSETIKFINIETGSVVDERPMTELDRQMTITGVDGKRQEKENQEDGPPRCHHGDMVLKEDDSGENEPYYFCTVCGATEKVKNTEE